MSEPAKKPSIRENYSFLVAIFLDGITLSLMFPLLNDLLVDKTTMLLPADYSPKNFPSN
jgi:uncharacterized membrane protein (DUF106 family)